MQNIYNQYKTQAVNTMTQGEMLVCLYDEAIKRLKRAKLLAANSDAENLAAELQRAREIISYLDQTLDVSYEISVSLHKLYEYFGFQLARAQAHYSDELIDELVPMLEELRDTWKEADILSRK